METGSSVMERPEEVRERVLDVLRSMPLRQRYRDEQKELQPEIKEALSSALGPSFDIVISVGKGAPKPRIEILGTTIWPDVHIAYGNEAIVAIETKLVGAENFTGDLAQALGQAVLYRRRGVGTRGRRIAGPGDPARGHHGRSGERRPCPSSQT